MLYFRFPDQLVKIYADCIFFLSFFFVQDEKKKKKKKKSDIFGLHRLFIYFQYGCALTSQTEHISAVYFEASSHISA